MKQNDFITGLSKDDNFTSQLTGEIKVEELTGRISDFSSPSEPTVLKKPSYGKMVAPFIILGLMAGPARIFLHTSNYVKQEKFSLDG